MTLRSVLFCNETATTEIYTYGHTLSLHDALPSFEAREVRALAALENARRIAIAERRDEIALHLRLAGEKRLIDRGIVETRHRPGVEPERARGAEAIGARKSVV